MVNLTRKVFFDANVLIEAGKPPGGPLISRVADLVKASLIEVLTTELTIVEVAKKHTENDFEVIKDVGRNHFRKLVKEYLGKMLPDLSKTELKQQIRKKYETEVREMLVALDAEIHSIDTVKPSVVLDTYSTNAGFFSGDGKKDQFPDAFIFEAIKTVATVESPVIIVSNDGDFITPCKGEKRIVLVKGIPALFQLLGLQQEAPTLGEFLDDQNDELVTFVDKEVGNWGLQVADVEDAEIDESTVTAVSLSNVVTFSAQEPRADMLVVGNMNVTATVSYTHPDWDTASYDSEDDVLIPFHDVSGETEVDFDAKFSMLISVSADGKPNKITKFQFANSDFVFVNLDHNNPYRFR